MYKKSKEQVATVTQCYMSLLPKILYTKAMPPVFYWLGEYIGMGLHWLSLQYWIWWAYFKIRAWRFCKSLWSLLAAYAVVVFLFTAILTFWAYLRDQTMSPEKLSDLGGMTNITIAWILLIAGVVGFILMFIIFVILSSFPKGRDVADKNFRFAKPTELEEFKSKTESRLTALEKFQGKTEGKLDVDKAKTPSNTRAKPRKMARGRK